MTKFNFTAIAAALFAALALALGSKLMLVCVIVAFAVVIGLGVTIPRLSLFGPYLCRGNTSRHCVALTFDDGPDPRSTPALLNLLREAGVKAAFFAVGKQVAVHPEIAAQIVSEGHLLENHSYFHRNTTNFYSSGRLLAELKKAQSEIQKSTGIAPKMFRPPMGLSNPRIFAVARALGLKVVGWTARGFDTQVSDPERIVARIARRLEPGAIILLHDGNIPAERLVTTVKLLLAKLRELGYDIERLDRLLT